MGVATGVVTQSQAQIPSIRPMGVVMGGVISVVPIPKVKYQGQIPPPPIYPKYGNVLVPQPRSQGSLLPALRSEREIETLENAGHVSPRIWEITKKRFGGGAGKCEICLYRA